MDHNPTQANPPRAPLDLRGISSYLLIAFGLPWLAVFIALFVYGARFDALAATISIGPTLLLAGVMLTPALAAFIVRRFITREGFATAGLRFGPSGSKWGGLRQGGWRPYLAVWLGVPALVILIYALTALLGLGTFDPTLSQLTNAIKNAAGDQPVPELPPPLVLAALIFVQGLIVGAVITTIFTFGEEFGWTGYLLVKLLPLGKWRAAIIYGIIWGLWHAPIIAGGHNYPGYPVLGIVMMCALTTAFALSQTALRLRYKSVFLTSFFHAAINTSGLGIIPMFVLGVSPVIGGITGIVGIAAFGALGAWLLSRTPEHQNP